MEKLFFLDTVSCARLLSDEIFQQRLISNLPETWRERIEKTNNTELRISRIAVYTLLAEAVLCEAGRIYPEDVFTSEMGAKKIPSLIFTKNGKPYLSGTAYGISISHTDGLSLVAISDKENDEIGVDIEKINERTVSVAQRFLSRYTEKFHILPYDLFAEYEYLDREDIFLYTLDENGLSRLDNYDILFTDIVTGNEGSVLDWCTTEALLKADGGGFASLPQIKQISDKGAPRTGKIIYKNIPYAVSLCKLPGEKTEKGM